MGVWGCTASTYVAVYVTRPSVLGNLNRINLWEAWKILGEDTSPTNQSRLKIVLDKNPDKLPDVKQGTLSERVETLTST